MEVVRVFTCQGASIPPDIPDPFLSLSLATHNRLCEYRSKEGTYYFARPYEETLIDVRYVQNIAGTKSLKIKTGVSCVVNRDVIGRGKGPRRSRCVNCGLNFSSGNIVLIVLYD